MNTAEMVARLNELDHELCGASGIPRSADATTLDAAIAMSTATTDLLLELGTTGKAGQPIDLQVLTSCLQAQVEARKMRTCSRVDIVQTLTNGIRRMTKAGSRQDLSRQACTELSCSLGFDRAAISFAAEGAFVVEGSTHSINGDKMIPLDGCIPEDKCALLLDSIRTNDTDLPPTAAFQQLLGSDHYLVTPVVEQGHVVALLHVSRGSGSNLSVDDNDVLDTFASAYSLLHRRILNTERVQQQRTSIAHAAARLTEQVDRIAAYPVSFDIEEDDRGIEPPTGAANSALAGPLSVRERQVFGRLVVGASNADIADELVITVETVKTHVKRILRKIGAINRSEAIALYVDETTKQHRSRN